MQHQTARPAAAQLTPGRVRDSKAAQVTCGSSSGACHLRSVLWARLCWRSAQLWHHRRLLSSLARPPRHAQPSGSRARSRWAPGARQVLTGTQSNLGSHTDYLMGDRDPPLLYNSQLLCNRAYFARCSTDRPASSCAAHTWACSRLKGRANNFWEQQRRRLSPP